MAFTKTALVFLFAVAGVKSLQCYSGNKNYGDLIVPKECDAGYSWCVTLEVYPNPDYGTTGDTHAFCDNGSWCNQVINQPGSNTTCCQTDLCNEVEGARTPAPAPLTCYSGNTHDGNIAPVQCDAISDYCVVLDGSYAFCDNGIFCPALNQTDYTCCQTDFCNYIPAPAPLTCYSGNTHDGNIAPVQCDAISDYCVVLDGSYAFCDNGIFCPALNQTDYTCCETDLCNYIPAASAAARFNSKPNKNNLRELSRLRRSFNALARQH